jgi:hypothetical protein
MRETYPRRKASKQMEAGGFPALQLASVTDPNNPTTRKQGTAD